MGFEFQPDHTPVLNYGPRSEVGYRDGSLLYIAWPAYAYRVLAPRPFEDKVNLFQRAVLGFCHMGVTQPERIAASLHLYPDLVALIQNELIGNDLLTRRYTLTNKGHQALRDDDRNSEVVVGYVFQDPWEGHLWPRFVERLNYQDLYYDSLSSYPKLVLGTKGDPRIKPVFFKHFDGNRQPVSPTVIEVLEACHRDKWWVKDSSSYSHTSRDPDLKVEIISETPEPVYLLTYIFFPENEDPRQGWLACDPFGLGISRRLYKAIESARKTDKELDRRIAELEKTFGSEDSIDEWMLVEIEAEDEVIQHLPRARDLPFFREIISMEAAYRPTDNLRGPKDFFVRAGIVLEGCFGFVQERYPLKPMRVPLLNHRESREELLNELASQLGFTTPLPKFYASISPDKIRNTAASGNGTLGERMVLLLLSAMRYQEHPLRFVAGKMPDFFRIVEEINTLRNQSAHYSPDLRPGRKTQEFRDVVLEIVSLLTGQHQPA